MPKMKPGDAILVSACLLGVPCRYDGKSKPNAAVKALSKTYRLIPVCPEVDGGLSTPRSPAEIKVASRGEKVYNKCRDDVTQAFVLGARKALARAKAHDIKLAVLKARSPSCGNGAVYDGSFSGTLREGDGITAALLKKNGITVITEEELSRL